MSVEPGNKDDLTYEGSIYFNLQVKPQLKQIKNFPCKHQHMKNDF